MTFVSLKVKRRTLTSFTMGKYTVTSNIRLHQSNVLDGEINKVFTGKINVSGKEQSKFVLSTIQSSKFIRIFVKLKNDSDPSLEDVVHNTSVRFLEIPVSNERSRRSNKNDFNSNVLRIDQFHVLNKFQRQGCGSKVMGIIFLWIKAYYPMIKKCFVVSPSLIGIPFYLKLGASRQRCSRNLEFQL